MKYLYVLTSDDSDYYLEQTLLSITSLRINMPNAYVSLLVDNITETNLTGKRKTVLDLVNECIRVDIDDCFNKKARSRFLKTSMRRHIKGDFLYIDGDTIIADDLSQIDNINASIGAVLDSHVYLSEYGNYYPANLKRMKAHAAKLGLDSYFDLNTRYNGGVLLCRDCTISHDFFREWHRLWLYCQKLGNITDQQSLNQANFNLGDIIKELSGIWNCQILNDGALRYLNDAKIIHYFATQLHEKTFLLAGNEYVESIKETGIVSDNIKELLIKPKSQFAANTRLMLIDRTLCEFYDSAIFGAAKRIYFSKLGIALEFVLARIRKYIFTPLRKKLRKS